MRHRARCTSMLGADARSERGRRPTVAKRLLPILFAATLLPATAHADPALESRGKALSKLHCARCHVVSPDNRMSGISSTPSFMIMVKALSDWRDRFETFYARRPHPAHIRLDTDDERPPDQPATIEEVVLQADDIDAIVAYAQSLERD
jgi:mono/diheme cytochrome c family protein